METLAADLLNVIDLAQEHPEHAPFVLAFGAVAATHRVRAQEPQSAFEAWLVERMLRRVRSEGWAASAEAEYLRAEWERER